MLEFGRGDDLNAHSLATHPPFVLVVDAPTRAGHPVHLVRLSNAIRDTAAAEGARLLDDGQ